MSASAPLPSSPTANIPPKSNIIQFPPNRTKYWENYAPRTRPPSAPPLPKLPAKVPFGGIGKILGGPVKSIVFDELFFTQPAAVADLTAIMPQSSSETIQSPSLPFNNGQSPQIPYLVNFRFRRTGSGVIDTSWTNGQARVIGPITKIQVFVGPDPGNPKNTLHVLTIFAGGGVLLGRDYDPTGKSKVYEWIVNWPTVDYEIISIVREDGRPDTGPPAPPPDPLINAPPDKYPGNPERLNRTPGDRKSPSPAPPPQPLFPSAPSPQPNPTTPAPSPNPDSVPAPISPVRVTPPTPNPNTEPPTVSPQAPATPSKPDKLFGPWQNPTPSQQGRLDPPNLPNYFTPNPLTPPAPFTPTPIQPNPITPTTPRSPVPNTTPPNGQPFTPTGPNRAPTPQPPTTPTQPKAPTEPTPPKDPLEEFKDQLKPLIDNAQFIPAIAAQTAPEALRNAAAEGTCRTTQPGGCTSNLINSAVNTVNANTNNKVNGLDAANALANAEQLRLLNILDTKLGAQIPGLGIGGKLLNFVNWSVVDRAMNLVSLMASLHNVFMLSNSVKETFFDILDNLLGAGFNVAPKIFGNSDGTAIDAREYFGNATDSYFSGLFGATEWAAIKAQWKAYSTIYQSATNVYENLRQIHSETQELCNQARNYVSELGNALQDEGMISEDNWNYKDPNKRIKSKSFAKLERIANGIDSLQNTLEAIEQVTSSVREITETANEIKENFEAINTAVNDANKAASDRRKSDEEGLELPNFSLEDLF